MNRGGLNIFDLFFLAIPILVTIVLIINTNLTTNI